MEMSVSSEITFFSMKLQPEICPQLRTQSSAEDTGRIDTRSRSKTNTSNKKIKNWSVSRKVSKGKTLPILPSRMNGASAECEQVLDPDYTPRNAEKDLFEAKQIFMFCVFDKHLLTDMGKTIIRKYVHTTDAQSVGRIIRTI